MSEALCSDHPGWFRRMQDKATNLNCMRFTGKLCRAHEPLPEANAVIFLDSEAKQATQYAAQTVALAASVPSDLSAETVSGEILVRPKDAAITLDGKAVAPGAVPMTLGKHSLVVTAAGFQPANITIVAYPDFQPHLKIELKRVP